MVKYVQKDQMFTALLGFFWESVPLLGEKEKKQRLDQLDLQFLLVTLDVA